MKILKYICLGIKANFRQSEEFRFGMVMLVTILLFVPLYTYIFYDYNFLGIDNSIGRAVVALLFGAAGWLGTAILVVVSLTLYLRLEDFILKLVNDGKKEEVRVFEILKGTDEETNAKVKKL